MLTSDKALADHTVIIGSLLGLPAGSERVSNKFEIACEDPKHPKPEWNTSCSIVGWSEDYPVVLEPTERSLFESLRQDNVSVKILYDTKQDLPADFDKSHLTKDEFKLHKANVEGRSAVFSLLNSNMTKCNISKDSFYRFQLNFKESIKHLFSTATAVKFASKGFELMFDSRLPQKGWEEIKARLSRSDKTQSINPFLGNMLAVKNSAVKMKIKASRMNHFVNSTSGDDAAFLSFMQSSVERMMVSAFYEAGVEMSPSFLSKVQGIPLTGLKVAIKLGNCFELITLKGNLNYLLENVSLKLQAAIRVFEPLTPSQLEILEREEEQLLGAAGRMQRLKDLAKTRRADRRREGYSPNQKSIVISEMQKKEAADFNFSKNANKVTVNISEGGKMEMTKEIQIKLGDKGNESKKQDEKSEGIKGSIINPPEDITRSIVKVPPPPEGNPSNPIVKPPPLDAILKKQFNRGVLGLLAKAGVKKEQKPPAPMIAPAKGVILPPPAIVTKTIVAIPPPPPGSAANPIVKPPPLHTILKKQFNKGILGLLAKAGVKKEKKPPAPMIAPAPGVILPPPAVITKTLVAIPPPPPGAPSSPIIKPPPIDAILQKQFFRGLLGLLEKKSLSPEKAPPLDAILRKQFNKGVLGLLSKSGVKKEQKPPAPMIAPAKGVILPPPAIVTKTIVAIPPPPPGSAANPIVKPPPLHTILKKQFNKGILGLLAKAGVKKEKKPPAPMIAPAPGVILPPPAVITKTLVAIPPPPPGAPSSPIIKPPPIDAILQKQFFRGLLGLLEKKSLSPEKAPPLDAILRKQFNKGVLGLLSKSGVKKEQKPPAPMIAPAKGVILPPPAIVTKTIVAIPPPPPGSAANPIVKPPPLHTILKKQFNKGILGLLAKAGVKKEKKPPAPMIAPAPGVILPPPAVITKTLVAIPPPPPGAPSSPIIKPPPIDAILQKQFFRGLLGLLEKKSLSPEKAPPLDAILRKQFNKGVLGLLSKSGVKKEQKPPAPMIAPAKGVILPPPAIVTKTIVAIPPPPPGSAANPIVKPPPLDAILKKQKHKALLRSVVTAQKFKRKSPAPQVVLSPGVIPPPPAVITKTLVAIPPPPPGAPSSPIIKPPPIDAILQKQFFRGLLGLLEKKSLSPEKAPPLDAILRKQFNKGVLGLLSKSGVKKEQKPPAPMIAPAKGVILPPPAIVTKTIVAIPPPPPGSAANPIVKPPPLHTILKKQFNKGILGLLAKAGVKKEKKPPAPMIAPAPGVILPPPAVITKTLVAIPPPPPGAPSSPIIKPPPIDAILQKQFFRGLLGLLEKKSLSPEKAPPLDAILRKQFNKGVLGLLSKSGVKKEQKPPAPMIAPAKGVILPPPAIVTKTIVAIPPPPPGSAANPIVKPPPLHTILKKQFNKGILGLLAKAGVKKEKKPPAPMIAPAPGVILPPPAVITKTLVAIPPPPPGAPSSPIIKPPPIDAILQKQFFRGLLGLLEKKSLSPEKAPPLDAILRKQFNKGVLGLLSKSGVKKEQKPPAPMIAPAKGVILPPPAIVTKTIFAIPPPPPGSAANPIVKPPPLHTILKKQFNKGILGLLAKAGVKKEKKPPAPMIAPAPGVILPPPAVITKTLVAIPPPPPGAPSSPIIKPPPIDAILQKQFFRGLLGLLEKKSLSPEKAPPLDAILRKQFNKGVLGLLSKSGVKKEQKPPAPMIAPAKGVILPPPAIVTKTIVAIPPTTTRLGRQPYREASTAPYHSEEAVQQGHSGPARKGWSQEGEEAASSDDRSCSWSHPAATCSHHQDPGRYPTTTARCAIVAYHQASTNRCHPPEAVLQGSARPAGEEVAQPREGASTGRHTQKAVQQGCPRPPLEVGCQERTEAASSDDRSCQGSHLAASCHRHQDDLRHPPTTTRLGRQPYREASTAPYHSEEAVQQGHSGPARKGWSQEGEEAASSDDRSCSWSHPAATCSHHQDPGRYPTTTARCAIVAYHQASTNRCHPPEAVLQGSARPAGEEVAQPREGASTGRHTQKAVQQGCPRPPLEVGCQERTEAASSDDRSCQGSHLAASCHRHQDDRRHPPTTTRLGRQPYREASTA
jgi:hypothetical protein